MCHYLTGFTLTHIGCKHPLTGETLRLPIRLFPLSFWIIYCSLNFYLFIHFVCACTSRCHVSAVVYTVIRSSHACTISGLPYLLRVWYAEFAWVAVCAPVLARFADDSVLSGFVPWLFSLVFSLFSQSRNSSLTRIPVMHSILSLLQCLSI